MKSVHTQKSALKKRIGIVILGFLLAMNLCGTAPLFAAAVDLDNLMVNGGFEDSALGSSWIEWDPNHGDYLIDSGMYSEGNRSLKLTGLGTGAYMMAQNLSLIPGQKYTLTAKLYVPSGQESAPQPYIYVAEKGSTEVARENYYNITADTWHSCKVSFVYNGAEENFTQFQFRLNGAGTVYWDDIVLKAEIVDPNGNLFINGSFEEGTNDWISWNGTAPAAVLGHATDGEYSLKMMSNGTDVNSPTCTFQRAKADMGKYLLRFDLGAEAAAVPPGELWGNVIIQFQNEAKQENSSLRFDVDFKNLSEEMKEFSIPISVSDPDYPYVCVTLRVYAKVNPGTVYWDNIRLMRDQDPNLFVNSSFEDGQSPWVDWNNQTYDPAPVLGHASDGEYSLRMQSNAWNNAPSIFQAVKAGEGNYMLRFNLCGEPPEPIANPDPDKAMLVRPNVLIEFKNESGQTDGTHRFDVSFDNPSAEMKEYAIPITANPGNPTISVTLRLLAQNCVGTVYWDNVRLEPYDAPAAGSLMPNRPCLTETELTIPDDGKTYMVQCFVWDSLDSLKPIQAVSVLK